jgi:hypothetical protein
MRVKDPPKYVQPNIRAHPFPLSEHSLQLAVYRLIIFPGSLAPSARIKVEARGITTHNLSVASLICPVELNDMYAPLEQAFSLAPVHDRRSGHFGTVGFARDRAEEPLVHLKVRGHRCLGDLSGVFVQVCMMERVTRCCRQVAYLHTSVLLQKTMYGLTGGEGMLHRLERRPPRLARVLPWRGARILVNMDLGADLSA